MRRILILANNGDTNLIEKVQLHLCQSGHIVVRINVSKFLYPELYPDHVLNITNDSVRISIGREEFELGDFDLIWKRRFNGNFSKYTLRTHDYRKTSQEILAYLQNEIIAIEDYILNTARENKTKIVNDYCLTLHDKLFQLRIARHIGIEVPQFMVSNRKDPLIAFTENHKAITKPMSNFGYLREQGLVFSTGTNDIGPEDISVNGQCIFPSFVQARVQSTGELKCLLVGKEVFAVRQNTLTDAIGADIKREYRARNVSLAAYELPPILKKKLLMLFSKFKVEICSFDLIIDDKGNYNFLEINADGIMDFYAQHVPGLDLSKTIAAYIESHFQSNEKKLI